MKLNVNMECYLRLTMKYRIVERRGNFYPQYRMFFIWFHFTGYDNSLIIRSTYEKALDYIKQKEAKDIYHKVKL